MSLPYQPWLLVALLVAGLTACGDDDGAGGEPAASPVPSATALPTLATPPVPPTAFGGAVVSGVLGINAQNCFTLDENVLAAPYGSKVIDARTVELAGIGQFELGQTPRGGGGQGDEDGVPEWLAPCLSATSKKWVALNPG